MTAEQIVKMTDRLLLKRASNLKQLLDIKHRLQSVAVLNGVEYIDDSKSTYATSTVYSLQCMKYPVYWIVDADLIQQDFSELIDCVQLKVKKIMVIGFQGSSLLSTFPNVEGAVYASLQQALEDCKKIETGNVVLFSPACPASELFGDYRQRGNRFVDLVQGLG